jgi:transposase
LVAVIRQAPSVYHLARSRWRLADLGKVLDWCASYSVSGMSKALTRLKVSRQRGCVRLHSPDPAYQRKCQWIDRVRTLALLPARPVTVLYGDEFSLYRQPTLAPTYAPVRQEPLAPLSLRANIPHRLSGALDLATGQVTWAAASKMGVAQLKRFLRQLRTAYPARRLFLIWDNWPVHQHPEVLATAAAQAIELLWLPTYAPWLNPIEKVWRWLKQDVLHHHQLADRFADLQHQVFTWLDQFAGPSPTLLRYVGEARPLSD